MDYSHLDYNHVDGRHLDCHDVWTVTFWTIPIWTVKIWTTITFVQYCTTCTLDWWVLPIWSTKKESVFDQESAFLDWECHEFSSGWKEAVFHVEGTDRKPPYTIDNQTSLFQQAANYASTTSCTYTHIWGIFFQVCWTQTNAEGLMFYNHALESLLGLHQQHQTDWSSEKQSTKLRWFAFIIWNFEPQRKDQLFVSQVSSVITKACNLCYPVLAGYQDWTQSWWKFDTKNHDITAAATTATTMTTTTVTTTSATG